MSVRDRPAPIGGGSLTRKTTTDLNGGVGHRKWNGDSRSPYCQDLWQDREVVISLGS